MTDKRSETEDVEENIIQMMLFAIKDSRVKKQIRKIAQREQSQEDENSKEIQDLKQKLEEYSKDYSIEKEKNQKLKKEKEQLEEKNKQLKQEKEQLEKECFDVETEFQKENNKRKQYEKKYGEIERLFKIYNDLPMEVKEDLSNVLNAESSLEFLLAGVQWDNISGLEDYIIANLYNDKKEISILQEIFDGLFELYAKANGNCERLHTKEGDLFDLDFHTRGSESKGVDGRIETVLFDGYKKGNNYIRKSIVWIKE